MTLVYKDRVLETTATTGTGSFTLAGAVTGHQAFSTVGNGNTCYYVAFEVDANGNSSGGWEVGLGTYTLSGTILARTSVLASSNGGSAVSFAAGTKRVALVLPASVASAVPTTAYVDAGDATEAAARATADTSEATTRAAADAALSTSIAAIPSAPFSDATSVVKGSGDATKLLRFEVDGFTAGQTRVITPPDSNTTLPIASQTLTFSGLTAARTITVPDANITLARTDAAQTFTGIQTFVTSIAGVDATADDTAGSDLVIAAGRSTGGGVTANVRIQASFYAGEGSSTLQALEDAIIIGGNGADNSPSVSLVNGTALVIGGGGMTVAGESASKPGVTLFAYKDAGTTNQIEASSFKRRTSGTPGVNFGLRHNFYLHLDAGGSNADTQAARSQIIWVNATNGANKARWTLGVNDSGTPTTPRECIRMEASGSAAMLGFFGATAVIKQAGTGETTGFTAGTGTAVKDDSTFTGNVGATAYRISDIVKALKNLGLLAS